MLMKEKKKKKEARHDMFLRKFQYKKALDWVLGKYTMNKHPERSVALIQELIRRKSFNKAISGCDAKFLVVLISFIRRAITDSRFTRILIVATNIFLDTYEDEIDTFNAEVMNEFKLLLVLLQEEIKLQNQLASLKGAFTMILAGAAAAEQQISINKMEPHNLVPSDDAQKNLIVNLT